MIMTEMMLKHSNLRLKRTVNTAYAPSIQVVRSQQLTNVSFNFELSAFASVVRVAAAKLSARRIEQRMLRGT